MQSGGLHVVHSWAPPACQWATPAWHSLLIYALAGRLAVLGLAALCSQHMVHSLLESGCYICCCWPATSSYSSTPLTHQYPTGEPAAAAGKDPRPEDDQQWLSAMVS